MSVLSDVREAVAERIRSSQLGGTINVYPHPPDDVSLPAILVLPAVDQEYIAYHGSFDPASGVGRMMTVRLTVRLIVPAAGSRESADRQLDDYLSSGTGEVRSIPDAIEDGTYDLDGAVAHAHCTSSGSISSGNLNVGSVESPIMTPVITADIPMHVLIQRS